MKTITTIIVVILLVAGTCEAGLQGKIGELLGLEDSTHESLDSGSASNTALTCWVLGTTDLDSQDNEIVGRFGVQIEDVEVGGQLLSQGFHGGTQTLGFYGGVHLEGDVSSWLGRPYIFFTGSVDTKDAGYYGAILGTVYADIFVTEVWYREFSGKLSRDLADENDVWKFFAGLKWEF